VTSPLLLNLLAAFAYAAGAAFMKASDGLRHGVPAALVYVCFCGGATVQAVALRRQEIGVSNTIVLGVEAIGAVALGMVFFREAMTPSKLLAIGLVGAGVYLLRAGG
jgi:quaternary ammonium compound-resistance protein SugE